MGNQQSNERKRNYKICKITKVDEHSTWVRCHLDDFIPYSDGEFAHIDFERDSNAFVFGRMAVNAFAGQDPVPDRAIPIEGYYLAIDIGLTRNFLNNDNFDKGFAKTVGREENNEIEGKTSIIAPTGEWCQAIIDSRMARAERIQQLRFQRQMEAWHLEPPKK